jgi:hypothetical protein
VTRARTYKLATYATKRKRGTELLALDDAQLVELVLALPRKRLTTWFGVWSNRSHKNGGAS